MGLASEACTRKSVRFRSHGQSGIFLLNQSIAGFAPSRHGDTLSAQVKAYRGSSSSMELTNRSSRANFDAGYAIKRYEPDTRHRRARS